MNKWHDYHGIQLSDPPKTIRTQGLILWCPVQITRLRKIINVKTCCGLLGLLTHNLYNFLWRTAKFGKPKICANGPGDTLSGSAGRERRFARENIGSGQTSGSVRIYIHILGDWIHVLFQMRNVTWCHYFPYFVPILSYIVQLQNHLDDDIGMFMGILW